MLKSYLPVVCLTLALGAVPGCSNEPAAKAAASGVSPAAGAPVSLSPAQQGPATASGAVVETMDAATYTYVRVKTATGEIWAATSQFKVAVGDKVVVPLEMPMENFHSNALKRDFALIYFTSRITREGESAGTAPIAMIPGHTPAGGGAPAADSAMPAQVIPPPAGATSVADLWANRKALAGKRVTVRGKVVKFNGGILGVNWMHIQDGTGSEKDGTNDITITSEEGAKVGDVITVTGTVVVDKDFGAGYAYVVLLEKATITAR